MPAAGPGGQGWGSQAGAGGSAGAAGPGGSRPPSAQPGDASLARAGRGAELGRLQSGGPRPYHTSQCLPGFMGEPSGQPKCCTKSRELLRVPMTRYLSGLCGSVTSPSCELSGVRTEHHTWGRGTAVGTGKPPLVGTEALRGGVGGGEGHGAVLAQSPRRRAGGW